jgi:hypothetical protein
MALFSYACFNNLKPIMAKAAKARKILTLKMVPDPLSLEEIH